MIVKHRERRKKEGSLVHGSLTGFHVYYAIGARYREWVRPFNVNWPRCGSTSVVGWYAATRRRGSSTMAIQLAPCTLDTRSAISKAATARRWRLSSFRLPPTSSFCLSGLFSFPPTAKVGRTASVILHACSVRFLDSGAEWRACGWFSCGLVSLKTLQNLLWDDEYLSFEKMKFIN